MKHEGWNIIQEYMIPWLDAFIASEQHNNTQYMHIYIYIFASTVKCVLNFQKKSQKLPMLEEKQGQFWNLHWIPDKVIKRYFQF